MDLLELQHSNRLNILGELPDRTFKALKFKILTITSWLKGKYIIIPKYSIEVQRDLASINSLVNLMVYFRDQAQHLKGQLAQERNFRIIRARMRIVIFH